MIVTYIALCWVMNGLIKLQDPWAATQHAFLRREADRSGLSVRPNLATCYRNVSPKRIQGVAKLRVADVRMVLNPVSGIALDVVQDSETHANIINVPFHSQDPFTALDLASDLADLAMVLNRLELLKALEMSGFKRGLRAKIVETLGLWS